MQSAQQIVLFILIILGLTNFFIILCELSLQIISDKRLVKHLQKEVARLEAKLQSPEPSSASWLKSLLMEKELKIQEVYIIHVS